MAIERVGSEDPAIGVSNLEIDRSLLEAALVGYQHEIDQMRAKVDEVHARMDTIRRELDKSFGSTPVQARKPHVLSAADRRKIAATQRKRWDDRPPATVCEWWDSPYRRTDA